MAMMGGLPAQRFLPTAIGTSAGSVLTADRSFMVTQHREQQVARRAVGRLGAGGQQQSQETHDFSSSLSRCCSTSLRHSRLTTSSLGSLRR